MAGTMEVLIDHRDHQAYELAEMVEQQWKSSTAARQSQWKVTARVANNLEVGDMVITRKATDSSEEQVLVVIERKEVGDLAASIKDGRYPDQFYRLTQTRAPVLGVLVVGELAALIRAQANWQAARVAQGKSVTPSPGGGGNNLVSSCVSALLHIPLMTWGWVQVWQVPSESYVPQMLVKMLEYLHRDGYLEVGLRIRSQLNTCSLPGQVADEAEMMMTEPPAELLDQRRQVAENEDQGTRVVLKRGKKRKADTSEDMYLAILCALPRFSPKLAQVLISHYPTFETLRSALVKGDTLAKVPGFGKGRLDTLKQVFLK